MKRLQLIPACIFLLLHTMVATGQLTQKDAPTPTSNISDKDLKDIPWQHGKWQSYVVEKLNFSHLNIKQNGTDQGHVDDLNLDLGTNYFVADHFAIGLELIANVNVTKNDPYKTSNTNWMAFANFTYQTSINHDLDVFGRAGIGYGGVTVKQTVSGNTTKSTDNLFGFQVEAGLPIRMYKDGPLYFTPKLFYHWNNEKFDDGKETQSSFGLSLDLETYLGCKEMICDHGVNYAFSKNAYDRGRSYLGFSTDGIAEFGTSTTKYDIGGESKINFSNTALNAEYMYYVMKNFALGAAVDFGNQVQKNSDADYKVTSQSILFSPMLEVNMPAEKGWNNLFLRGGYSFGSEKNESTSGNVTNTDKSTLTKFCVGIGYNFFFHKRLSFTPIIEYEAETAKNKDTDLKETRRGVELGIGVRAFF